MDQSSFLKYCALFAILCRHVFVSGEGVTLRSVGEQYEFQCAQDETYHVFMVFINDHEVFKNTFSENVTHTFTAQSFDSGTTITCSVQEGLRLKTDTLLVKNNSTSSFTDPSTGETDLNLSPITHTEVIAENNNYEFVCDTHDSSRIAVWLKVDANNVVTDAGYAVGGVVKKVFNPTYQYFNGARLVCLQYRYVYTSSNYYYNRDVLRVVQFVHPCPSLTKKNKSVESFQRSVKDSQETKHKGLSDSTGAASAYPVIHYHYHGGIFSDVPKSGAGPYPQGAELGSDQRPSPAVCKFLPANNSGEIPDPYWVMAEQKFPVSCESNKTCLSLKLNDTQWISEHSIFVGSAPAGLWLSKSGFNFDDFNTISRKQLEFLKEQSTSIVQTIRVYLLNTSFEHIKLRILNFNDVIIDKTPSVFTPMYYSVETYEDAVIKVDGKSWNYVDLVVEDEVQRLPAVDFYLEYQPTHLRDVSVSVQLRQLCFT